MRCEAQDVPRGKPRKRIATTQRARIRQDKLGSLFLATSLESLSNFISHIRATTWPASRQKTHQTRA